MATSGDRLYEIRLACGDGRRKAESLEDFVERVRRVTGVSYDASTISLLERMKQRWKLDDVRVLAAVDPLDRGRAWLAALDEEVAPEVAVPDPAQDRKLSQQEIARAMRQAEIETRERTRQVTKKKKGGRK